MCGLLEDKRYRNWSGYLRHKKNELKWQPVSGNTEEAAVYVISSHLNKRNAGRLVKLF